MQGRQVTDTLRVLLVPSQYLVLICWNLLYHYYNIVKEFCHAFDCLIFQSPNMSFCRQLWICDVVPVALLLGNNPFFSFFLNFAICSWESCYTWVDPKFENESAENLTIRRTQFYTYQNILMFTQAVPCGASIHKLINNWFCILCYI